MIISQLALKMQKQLEQEALVQVRTETLAYLEPLYEHIRRIIKVGELDRTIALRKIYDCVVEVIEEHLVEHVIAEKEQQLLDTLKKEYYNKNESSPKT